MIIKQGHKCPLNAIFDKRFPKRHDLIEWDDFCDNEINTEKLKAKIESNIKHLQNVIKDIEELEQKAWMQVL